MKKENSDQDLEVNAKKKILEKITKTLSEERPELYYVDSSSVSHLIRTYIHEGKLSKEDFEKVKDLSSSDILILLSFNSSCC